MRRLFIALKRRGIVTKIRDMNCLPYGSKKMSSMPSALRSGLQQPCRMRASRILSTISSINFFLSFRYMGALPRLPEIMEKVSVKNIQYYRVDEAIFHNIVDSLFRNDPVKISYHSPHKNETTDRIILPLHLLCYMGSWHVIAFCTLRNELRDFALSRIRSIETISDKITLPDNMPSIKEYMRQNFGLMSGEKSTEVCLKFAPDVSSWISEQIWHKKQAVSTDSNGNLFLRIPVADFREIRREILKFGANLEVLSPEELRNEIKEEIKKMSAVYR